jgi:hypothetical protein
MVVSIIDPVADYAELLESLFDFDRIARLLARPDFRMRFDAMHAVTGPYALEILEESSRCPRRYGGQRYRRCPISVVATPIPTRYMRLIWSRHWLTAVRASPLVPLRMVTATAT